jgi:hypothetical protein
MLLSSLFVHLWTPVAFAGRNQCSGSEVWLTLHVTTIEHLQRSASQKLVHMPVLTVYQLRDGRDDDIELSARSAVDSPV